jgi:hypothetical protein
MPELSEQEILNRIRLMDKNRGMERFRKLDADASGKYLDANSSADDQDWDLPDDFDSIDSDDTLDSRPIGQPNYLAINNETKIAAVAMGRPALHVKANEDEELGGVKNSGEVVAKSWEQSWDNGNWRRETMSGLQKLGICGLGMLWYRWDDEYGPCFEHVHSRRLLIDPHATNLQRMEYGGVKVRMSLRKAKALYDPNGENEFFHETNATEEINQDNTSVVICLYFDRETEFHSYNGKMIFKDENLYRKVPLIPIEGFIDPRDRLLPLGDNVFAAGLNQQIVDLAAIASSTAKNGGPITLADGNQFDAATKVAIQEGKPQQIIFTKGPINPQALPITRVSGEQLSPAYPEARREVQYAMDGIMGVTSAARGEQIPNVTATQSVMVEQRAGARPTQVKADYEQWITRMARAYVEMMQRFGGPVEGKKQTKEQTMVWEAFKAVYEVTVVEDSTSFRNPAADQQATMQLYTTLAQTYELWMALYNGGYADAVPNLKQVTNDMYRAFSRQNIESYWTKPEVQGSEEPPDALLKSLASIYKDAPPDVRRMIEENFGVTPSQMGDQADTGEPGKSPLEITAETAQQAADHQHDKEMAVLEHELKMEELGVEHQHESEIKAAEIETQEVMADKQASSQQSLAAQNNDAAIKREKAKPRPKPSGGKK